MHWIIFQDMWKLHESSTSISIRKVWLELSHTHSCVVYGCFHTTMANFSHYLKYLFSGSLQKNILLTPILKYEHLIFSYTYSWFMGHLGRGRYEEFYLASLSITIFMSDLEILKMMVSQRLVNFKKDLLGNWPMYSSPPLSVVSLSVVSVMCGQPVSENIKCKIPEIDNS